MSSIKKVTLPLTKEKISNLKAGDIVELTGIIYTARDAAHERIFQSVKQGELLPFDVNGEVIFYCGPCPAKPGEVVGSLGPTTSARMDSYMETMLKLGMSGCIGKGDRADYVTELIKKYSSIYFVGVGGASALAAKAVKSAEEIAYHDLGAESIKRYYVEDFKVVVFIDCNGNTINIAV